MENNIRKIRKLKKLTLKDLAEPLNTSTVQIGYLETGKRKLSQEWMVRIAGVLECEPVDLISGPTASSLPEGAFHLGEGHQVPILGEVQAGAWRPVGEIIEPHDVTKFVTFFSTKYPIDKQYGLKVIGDSMNLVILANSYIICVNIDDGIPSPSHGDLVVAEHIEDGQIETTVKKLALTLDGVTLLPCSSNGDYKPLVLNNLPKGCEVKIKARVVGAVQEF